MKKVLSIFTLLLAFGICSTLYACSEDKEDEPIETGTSDAEAAKFIGTWYSSDSKGGYWTFNADGTCTHTVTSNMNILYGQWSYAAESKVLTTTILSWNWMIIAVSENSWTGTHLGGNRTTFTYTRRVE
ncbi:MAG: hypothetical protein PUB61_02700 [Bacteroidales bacterium]|nr:hypothetical protein [Bacteroidales bacterium]MDD6622070.1 hypothetical protein [Bacteroidales bacterium]